MTSAWAAGADWAASLLTGSFATGIGTVAVAMVGFAALTGSLRRATVLRVLLGLVILFSAPRLATGLLSYAASNAAGAVRENRPPIPHAGEDRARPICWTCNQGEAREGVLSEQSGA